MTTRKSAIDIRSKLAQKGIVDHIRHVDFQSTSTTSPLIVELDPTAACDLACPGCISEDIIAEGGRFSNERLLELGHEMVQAGVKGVILIGGGEPLAHPKIGNLIKLLGESNVAIGITTNGTFIQRHEEEIAKYASWTRVSFDAASQETFNQLRPSKAGKNKFDQIVENMKSLSLKKKGLLGFSFLIQTPADGLGVVSNVHEIYEAAVLAKEIGCDYFEVKPSYQWRNDVPHALMIHDSELMESAKLQIQKTRRLTDAKFSVYEAINLAASLDGVQTHQEKDYSRCPSAELRTLITPTGGYICPYWRGKSDMWFGDYKTQSFSSVWEGLHRSIVMDRVNPARNCNFHCLRHESNKDILVMKNMLESGKNILLVDDYDPFI